MKRWVLFALTITLTSIVAFGQAVVTPSGQATQGGVAVPVAPVVSPPLVTTPLIHLGNAATTNVGTSTAAVTLANGQQAEPPSAVPIRPEISLGPETIYVGAPNANEANANAGNMVNPTSNGRQMIDLGVNSGGAVVADDGTHGRSLGEIARENRQRMQGANARTFTNSDVERMAGAGGVSGIATDNPPNASLGNNGVINNTANPAAVAAPATPPTTEQKAQPENEPRSPFQKPSGATTPHEMAQAQTPANPADQNANAVKGDQNAQQRTLPKSASPLPLIAVGGLLAAGAGLVARKMRGQSS